MNYQESTTSMDEDPAISDFKDGTFTPSLTRGSVITYTTDLEDSSVLSTETELDRDYMDTVKRKSAKSLSIPINNSPFYRRRRFWAVCGAFSVILSAIFIPLFFLVIIPNVAQSSVNDSQINFDAINITNPTNDNFIVSMSGTTSGTGPFSATITFNGPVDISYNGAIIGSVELDPIEVSGGKGTLAGEKRLFVIRDKAAFNDFTSKVLSAKEFEWTLQGKASVKTFGMNLNNLKVNKKLTIPGSNNFNTSVLDLKITENQDKTISLEILTNVYNPSPIGIEIGDMTTQLSYNQTLIATTIAKNVFIGAKANNITLTGVTKAPATEQDRLNMIAVTNSFLTNTPLITSANILSIVPKNGPVDWLNSAVKGFSLSATVGNNPNPLKLISNLDLGEETLKFTTDEPYSPTISSKNAVADYALPFNISFTILEVGQKITIARDNKDIITLESPEVPVISTPNQLSLNISETKLQVLDAGKFSDLLADLATNKESEVVVYGKTTILTNTDILGQALIQGIPFNLTTKFQGFDQFNSDGHPPVVQDLTILSGSSNQLFMGIIVVLTNPSKYSTSVGQVSFDMFYKDKKIGTTVIPDLSVVPGPNPVTVMAILDDPGKNPDTVELFKLFLTGQSATVNIKGNEHSTNITSLIPAFKSINIPSSMPPLQTPFIKSSRIVFDNQTATTNVSTGIVEMTNPFVAPISIYAMNSSFSFNGIELGSLEQNIYNNPIFIPGNTDQTLQFPVKMVVDPVVSFTVLRTLALQNNMDVTVLDSLIALSNVSVPGADPNANPTPEVIQSFDMAKFVTTAMAKIPVTVTMDSQVAIGNYFMSMSYKQDIIATTDQSILNMVPALAAPLVNHMIGQSEMSFDSMFVQNIDVNSFDTVASGQILNAGPLPATISFPDGAYLYSENTLLGQVLVPPITTGGDNRFNNVSKFIIADIPTFSSFSAKSYSAQSVSMELASDNVMITSFGLPIGPISIRKAFQIDGFNGLKQFTLNKLTFPLSVTIDVNNPARVGVELGKVVYALSVNNEQIATVTSNSVTINPKAVSSVTFQGDLNLDPKLVQSFFAPDPPAVVAQGISVTPPKATGEVVWLAETLKSFTLTVPFSAKSLLNGKGVPPVDPSAPAAPPAPPAA
ncbi:unnamed protein product [Rhizophagus irregularis]|nr:unnamed protein product [Rhizophagus irregularis]